MVNPISNQHSISSQSIPLSRIQLLQIFTTSPSPPLFYLFRSFNAREWQDFRWMVALKLSSNPDAKTACSAPAHSHIIGPCYSIHCNPDSISYDIRPTFFDLIQSFIAAFQLPIVLFFSLGRPFLYPLFVIPIVSYRAVSLLCKVFFCASLIRTLKCSKVLLLGTDCIQNPLYSFYHMTM